jgi:putative serine protease PepD
MAPVSENEPGRPDPRDDDTAPLWGGEPSYDSSYYARYGTDQAQHGAQHGAQNGAQHGAPHASYDPWAGGWHQDHSTTQLPQQGWYERPRESGNRLPGWVLPAVAATALLLGLVGGTVGSALVSLTTGGDGAPTILESQPAPAPAPVEPDNGSVAAVAQALLPSTVQVVAGAAGADGSATGSGFVVDQQGHVITNNHVVAEVAEGGQIEIVDHAGRRHSAELVGRSAVYDIAVLDVEGGADLTPAALGSSRSMNVGETVVAIGSPLGLSSTVTSGIVSALDRPVTAGNADDSSFINAVQTDAAINPGNSGGPLVNLRGEVVGVNSAIATMGSFAGSAGNIGVGFAIPMEQVRITAGQILETGEAMYPVIGANVNTGSRRNGAEIVDVPSGSPADAAGLEVGDVVTAVDDTAVTDGIGLIVAIRSHRPGETIELTLRRDGAVRTVEITLDAKVG